MWHLYTPCCHPSGIIQNFMAGKLTVTCTTMFTTLARVGASAAGTPKAISVVWL